MHEDPHSAQSPSIWHELYQSHGAFILAQLFERDPLCLQQVVADVLCEYRGTLVRIEDLAEQLRDGINGSACIPELGEYRFAQRVVAWSQRLGILEGEALCVYTGYHAAMLTQLAQEAALAQSDAYAALYG